VFFPSNVQDILDMGLHAFAMSRFSGVWSGMKTIQEVVESSASVSVDPDRVKIILPEDFAMPPGGLHIRWPDVPLEQEARLMDYKWYAALAYVRANKLNYNVIEGPNDRFGIIASGKAYNDTRQALMDLGLDDDTCRQLGIRVHKVNVVWPLEATITRELRQGLQEILVVEEKRQVIEYQLKEELYNWRADVRPNVLGKFDEPGGDASGGEWSMPNPSQNWLLRAKADLTPAIIAKAIAKRLKKLGVPADIIARMDARLATIEARERAMLELKTDTGERTPWFCSGCPHNTSTRVPEGSRAVAGIGCHYMTVWMDRSTSTFTQMGGEGVPWVGQAPFTSDRMCSPTWATAPTSTAACWRCARASPRGEHHLQDPLQRRGGHDRRPAGGRAPRGPFGAADHEQPQGRGRGQAGHRDRRPRRSTTARRWPRRHGAPPRRARPHAARAARDPGLHGILIYDQTCATEKRRRRKRGKLATPDKRWSSTSWCAKAAATAACRATA
jgi:indolepyruvate ferredoxin oxidoreductase